MNSSIIRHLQRFFLVVSIFGCARAESPASASITGPVIWSFQTGRAINAAPVSADGVVYCGSMNGLFFAIDANTGQLRWKFTSNRFPISSRAAISGEVVCVEAGNTLYGLDRATGQERWHYCAKPFRPIFSMDSTDYHHSSPVIENDVAYFGDDWGNLNGVQVSTGSLVFQFTTATGRPIRATPAVKKGIVYFGDWEGEVYAVSLTDKKLVWQYTLENMRPLYGAIVSEFVIDGRTLYFGSQHDTFSPLDIDTGRPLWQFVDANKTYLPATPLISGGRVIIASTVVTNSVLCLDHGKPVWSFKAEGIFFTKPVLRGSALFINSTSFGKTGYLYTLDVETGTLLNKISIERASPSAPELSGEKLFLGAGDGCIYALDLRKLLPSSTDGL